MPERELLEALSCDIVEDFVENIHFRASVFQSVEETGWVEFRMKGRSPAASVIRQGRLLWKAA